MTEEKQLLSVASVAEMTGLSAATIARLCRQGRIAGAVQSDIKTGAGYAWLVPFEAVASITARGKGRPDGARDRRPRRSHRNGGNNDGA